MKIPPIRLLSPPTQAGVPQAAVSGARQPFFFLGSPSSFFLRLGRNFGEAAALRRCEIWCGMA